MATKQEYALDIDAIMDWCFEEHNTAESEITNQYIWDEEQQKMFLASKEVHEVKSGGEANAKETIRYDIIKLFIADLMETDADELGFGDSVIINTLLSKKFMKPIGESEE